MSRIPLPSRGQPLDLAYLYQIANAINDLSSQASSSSYKYISVDDPASKSTNTVTINESKIVATYKEVATNSTITAGNEISFNHTFDSDFRFPPIVTATPINIGNTSAGKDVAVILKTVTTSRIEGIVRFATSGDVSVGVNLIAIGIPN